MERSGLDWIGLDPSSQTMDAKGRSRFRRVHKHIHNSYIRSSKQASKHASTQASVCRVCRVRQQDCHSPFAMIASDVCVYLTLSVKYYAV